MATLREVLLKIDMPIYCDRVARQFPTHRFDLKAGVPAPEVRARASVLVTNGGLGVSRSEMAALPRLGLICCVGTGYENVDLEAARERGIKVTHAAGANAPAVADHAFALLLAVVRKIPRYDAMVRAGAWHSGSPTTPLVEGKRLGIVGMGNVGKRIARRAEGFSMEIYYTATAAKPDLPWKFFPSVTELAAEVDFLISAAPGGSDTFHMIDTAVLDALGPTGFLVNIGRGTVVDTAALIAALRSGAIAGAGLDVFENEPHIAPELWTLANLVMTPHVAGLAPEIQTMSAELLCRNIEAFLASAALITPIPEMADR